MRCATRPPRHFEISYAPCGMLDLDRGSMQRTYARADDAPTWKRSDLAAGSRLEDPVLPRARLISCHLKSFVGSVSIPVFGVRTSFLVTSSTVKPKALAVSETTFMNAACPSHCHPSP